MNGTADTLHLIVGGQDWSGWQRVAVTRSMDTMPANFDIQVTEKFPLAGDIAFTPGDACVVKIDGDVVLTGFIDRYSATLGPADHTIRIAGRSKSEDLVDCSAFSGTADKSSFQVTGGTAPSIAQQLAKPYGITVNSIGGEGSQPIPQFNIAPGETVWEVIDRITRYAQLIAYDMPDGSVQLAQAGTEKMASGFTQGQNVEQAAVAYSMDQRFSEYICFICTPQVYIDGTALDAATGGHATDAGVPRFRRRYIMCEQTQNGVFIAQKRADWECNRRKGRSQMINLTADGWRDSAGTLWAINHQAPVDVPALKCSHPDWLIGAVTYLRDEAGQHALVTMMPKEAFLPEPTGTLGLVLLQDIQANNPTQPDNPPAPGAAGAPQGSAGIPGLPGSPSGPSAR